MNKNNENKSKNSIKMILKKHNIQNSPNQQNLNKKNKNETGKIKNKKKTHVSKTSEGLLHNKLTRKNPLLKLKNKSKTVTESSNKNNAYFPANKNTSKTYNTKIVKINAKNDQKKPIFNNANTNTN